MSTLKLFLRQIHGVAALTGALLLMPATPPLLAQSDGQRLVIETVTVQNRSPDSIRQAILPQLSQGARIGQIGEHLVIATTQQNLSTLRNEIERLDVAPRLMQVSVDFNFGVTVDEDQIETRTVIEEETLLLTYTADEEPHYLAIRVVQQNNRLQLSYGVSGYSDTVADNQVLLGPGQWHVIDEDFIPRTPADFLLRGAPTEDDQGPRIAIRVIPADSIRTE